MLSERKHWLDHARGIGILLVVYAHTQRGIERAGVAEHAGALKIVYDAIYSFHMPLFFVLAGYTAALSASKGKSAFIRSKTKTIAYPYFIWSLIVGTVLLRVGNATNGEALTVWDLVAIPYKPLQHFWFLQTLFIFEVAFILLGNRIYFFALSLFLYVAASIFLRHDTPAHNFTHFPIYFGAGSLLVGRRKSLINFSWAINTLGFVTTFAAAEVGGYHYMDVAFLPASVFGILTITSMSKRLGSVPWLSYLGKVSLTIYVAHILFASGARIALSKLEAPASIPLYLGLCTTVGIAGPLVLQTVLERLNLLWVLGLGRRQRASVETSRPTDPLGA